MARTNFKMRLLKKNMFPDLMDSIEFAVESYDEAAMNYGIADDSPLRNAFRLPSCWYFLLLTYSVGNLGLGKASLAKASENQELCDEVVDIAQMSRFKAVSYFATSFRSVRGADGHMYSWILRLGSSRAHLSDLPTRLLGIPCLCTISLPRWRRSWAQLMWILNWKIGGKNL